MKAPAILTATVIVLASSTAAWAQMQETGYNELFEASLGYASAARSCGDRNTVETSRNTLIRVLNYGDFHDLLNENSRAVQRDMAAWLRRGQAQYERQKWVTCEIVQDVVRQLDQVSRDLPTGTR